MASSSAPKLVIFGANGYVGSTIARIAVDAGVRVVGCSRSGNRPQKRYNSTEADNAWVDDVEWAKVDALNRADVGDFLDYQEDVTAVVSAVGVMSMDQKLACRINGDANVNIAAALYERHQIRRMVYTSAATMRPADRVIHGYYRGKQLAERAMFENLHGRGVALRPGMVSGTRIFTAAGYGLPLPLWLAGKPMELIFAPLHRVTGLSILTPPSDVETLAKAALYAALQEPIPEDCELAGYDAILAKAKLFEPSHLRVGAPIDEPVQKSAANASDDKKKE